MVLDRVRLAESELPLQKLSYPVYIGDVCSTLVHHKIEISGVKVVTFLDKTKTVFVVERGSPDGVAESGTNQWYNPKFGHWETATFMKFRALITSDMVYLGFWEWIGPTILHSAQLARETYGLEPDMVAYRSLALNAKANYCFRDRLKLISSCINVRTGAFNMQGAMGSSLASLSE